MGLSSASLLGAPSRRELLAQAGAAITPSGITEASSGPLISPQNADRPLKVVVAGGHPGDPEYGCGGTVALYAQRKADVVLLYLNRGQGGIARKSAEAAAAIRTTEAKKACEILGARPLFADQIDGASVVDKAHYDAFFDIVKAESPDILFTQWPIDNHPDHRAVSLLSYEAWLRMGKRFRLYYYEVSNGEDTMMFSPTEYVDISAVEAKKRAACFAHASQSPDRFYSLQDRVARFRGTERGFAAAEAFIRHVQSPHGQLP
jgi:LmbE family N-acetylglucosaminyl deacetylase